jgi:ABC-type transport system substrate-binding protein
MSNYWQQVTRTRLTRRRTLATSGGAVLGAAFLAACGSGSESGGTQSDKSSLVMAPVDTTASAKPGGTIKHWADGDAVHFDGTASNANGVINWVSAFAYPRMLRFQTPKYPQQGKGEVEGELAESYELSGDKLTLTFKLRPGLKWDSRAPTNGRVIDAEDIMFSWKKFAAQNPSGGNMAYERSPSAPVESISAPDSRTIVMKMHHPESSIVQLFASWDHFYPQPREAGIPVAQGGFDPRQTVRGHGPWMLEEHVPSSRFIWKKNPDYFLKDRPFADRLERPIIPEYAARLAQFKQGNILTTVATPNDIVATKNDVPATVIRQEPNFTNSPTNYQAFGYEGDSPFKDQRVRQAFSMLIDREAFVDAIDNRDNFKASNIDMPVAYHTVLPPGYNDMWLNPQDAKKFGDNAKYLTYNVPEAKKLLAAAGYANGFSFDMYYSQTLYAQPYQKVSEVINGMVLEGGLKGSQRGFPYEQFKDIYYEAYYGPSYTSGKTKGFNGVVHLADPAVPTVASFLFTFVHKNGGRFHGFTPDGKNAHQGDPKLNDMIDKMRAEFDRNKQLDLSHEIQRYFTGQSYYIPRAATVKPLTLTWPALGNMGVFQASPGENQWAERNVHWWVDQTKPPFTS